MHLIYLCHLLLLLFSSLSAQPLQVSVAAQHAILINLDSGAILYEKKPHDLCHPASITKIATAAYVLNETSFSLDEKITAQQDAVGSISEEAKRLSNYTLPSYWLIPGASHIGIKRGEILTLRDLLYGMMLASGDDASNVIAQHVGGTIPDFMDQINEYLVSIGCKHTYFNNPHGLYHPKHQTTAFDMALLTRHALKNPLFCEIVATKKYTRPKTNKQEPTILLQTNRLLREGKFFYPKAIGVKTGHFSIAQNTFVGAAKHNDRTLIAVLLKTKDRSDIFSDSIKLFEAAFNEKKRTERILPSGDQPFELTLRGAKKPVKTFTKDPIDLEYYPAEEPTYKTILVWDPVLLPVKKNMRVGEIRLESLQGTILGQTALYAKETVSSTWTHWLSTLLE